MNGVDRFSIRFLFCVARVNKNYVTSKTMSTFNLSRLPDGFLQCKKKEAEYIVLARRAKPNARLNKNQYTVTADCHKVNFNTSCPYCHLLPAPETGNPDLRWPKDDTSSSGSRSGRYPAVSKVADAFNIGPASLPTLTLIYANQRQAKKPLWCSKTQHQNLNIGPYCLHVSAIVSAWLFGELSSNFFPRLLHFTSRSVELLFTLLPSRERNAVGSTEQRMMY